MPTTENAKSRFDAGDLAGAVAAGIEDVRQNPTDTQRRLFLAELFCFQGDIERADRQLDVIVQQQPDAVLVLQFRQLLRAEQHRQETFTQGRAPEFLLDPPEHLRLQVRAGIHFREGDVTGAQSLLDQAEQARPELSGTCDGKPFSLLRDLDDLTASFFEVLTNNGHYYWVPFEAVRQVEFHAPVAPRDLLWRRASMTVAGGPDGEVFVAATYYDSCRSDDDGLRLGRATDWRENPNGPTRGIGQRVFLMGDNDYAALEIGQIEINPVSDTPSE